MKVLWDKINNKLIKCLACCHYCKINQGKTGICGVRKNVGGKLKLLVDGKTTGVAVDPIEKKPLYHFMPGSKALSFGTFGCNFSCRFCQNWHISQTNKGNEKIIDQSQEYSPKTLVEMALRLGCESIAYTYNEPTIFVEYALKTMKLAKGAGLKNVWVSNGYFSPETRKLIIPYLDAINIDIKSMRPEFYKKICGARLEPVLKNIKKVYQAGVHIELATLVIPGENDSREELEAIAKFIFKISDQIVWHILGFRPAYKMMNREATSEQILEKARQIGKKIGLKRVY